MDAGENDASAKLSSIQEVEQRFQQAQLSVSQTVEATDGNLLVLARCLPEGVANSTASGQCLYRSATKPVIDPPELLAHPRSGSRDSNGHLSKLETCAAAAKLLSFQHNTEMVLLLEQRTRAVRANAEVNAAFKAGALDLAIELSTLAAKRGAA